MHFIGTLSFPLHIPIGYDVPLTIYSLIIAVLVTLESRRRISRWLDLRHGGPTRRSRRSPVHGIVR